MQQKYPRKRLHYGQPLQRKRLLKRILLPFMMLFIISITTTFAQNEMNYLYLTGQIINSENGAPIAHKEVFIQSDMASGGGMSFTHVKYTDANGFFCDTISTIAEKGSLFIYAFDIIEVKHETREYFRFLWEDTYYANISLEVFDPVASDFQANFYPIPDTINFDSLTYYFTDESTGTGIVTWQWDFGDGHTSIEQNPKHVYTEAGIFEVSLSISTEHLSFDAYTSSVVKKLKVGMKSYYHFGGHAFAGYFPVDAGTAYLYKIEEDDLIPIDTTVFDTLGYYFFYQLIDGNYKVKTFPSPNSSHAGSFLPTYYGNTLLWTKAQTIKLDATSWEYDIDMVVNFAYGSGAGSIDGLVFLEGNKEAVEDVEIILFNQGDNCLTYLKSGKGGTFEFESLPYGTYKVLADVPGKFTYPTTITLSADNPTVEDINIVIYDEDIYHGIGNDVVSKLTGLGDPYPNPARSYVNFKFNLVESGNIQVFVLNQSGQVVDKYSAHHFIGENLVQLNTSSLSSGMYKLMVLFGNEKHIKSFIKVN